MTWIIHRGDRKQMYNTDMSQSIHVGENKDDGWCVTVRFGQIPVSLEYPNETEAKQSFGYLMEAIKKGERLAHI